jgi:phage baseplate assembly protein W
MQVRGKKMEDSLYKNIKVIGYEDSNPVISQRYKGISTVNDINDSKTLYDIAIIKQDIINHFHIRQGEKLENPSFGTIIWDVLFEPLTEDLRQAVLDNVTEIVNSDPRVQVDSVFLEEYESGLNIECTLRYLNYNISEKMRFDFDQNNGLIS